MALDQEHRKEGKSGEKAWPTFLMLAASALLGGTAVALWNRRLLAQIREQDRCIPPPDLADVLENDDAA